MLSSWEGILNIGILREISSGETRVALVPLDVKKYVEQGHQVLLETGAGLQASFSDHDYRAAGAQIKKNASDVYGLSEAILKVRPPLLNRETGENELALMKPGGIYIGFILSGKSKNIIGQFKKKKITGFSMEFVPRITRAQSMDALSSMATLAGYKAVLLAAGKLPKIFPLLMTAAGTVPSAMVLVLGAGVAGLQAIATAKRLGATVEAFDPRPAVREQVMSLGGRFVKMETVLGGETEGGYARMQSEEFLRREQDVIASRLPGTDVVITTAQVFGKKSPLLITDGMISRMNPGSVIVDIAAEQGGNCELTVPGKTVTKHGVSIIGAINLPSTIPVHASMMYSKNISSLFFHLFKPGNKNPDFDDEITAGACIFRNGEITNIQYKKMVGG
jgi:NAD(P) transhydrogenase subunit alpha